MMDYTTGYVWYQNIIFKITYILLFNFNINWWGIIITKTLVLLRSLYFKSTDLK